MSYALAEIIQTQIPHFGSLCLICSILHKRHQFWPAFSKETTWILWEIFQRALRKGHTNHIKHLKLKGRQRKYFHKGFGSFDFPSFLQYKPNNLGIFKKLAKGLVFWDLSPELQFWPLSLTKELLYNKLYWGKLC